MKKISIIITAYKTQDYIEECLLSIQNQTYFVDNKDYEILLGIDGDKELLNHIQKIKSKIYNLQIYNSSKNVGTYILRNSLVQKSNGKYLLFFDSDDVLYDNVIKDIMSLDKHDYVRFNYMKKICACGCFWISKKLFDSIGGFQSWVCNADQEFRKRVKKNNIEFVVVNNEKLSMYRRRHNNKLTKSKNTGMKSELRKTYRDWINNNTDWSIPIIPKITEIEQK